MLTWRAMLTCRQGNIAKAATLTWRRRSISAAAVLTWCWTRMDSGIHSVRDLDGYRDPVWLSDGLGLKASRASESRLLSGSRCGWWAGETELPQGLKSQLTPAVPPADDFWMPHNVPGAGPSKSVTQVLLVSFSCERMECIDYER
jgi:hypothetical protein